MMDSMAKPDLQHNLNSIHMANKGIETGEVSEPFYENVQNPQDLAAVKDALLKA